MSNKYIKVVEKIVKWDIEDIQNLFMYNDSITGSEIISMLDNKGISNRHSQLKIFEYLIVNGHIIKIKQSLPTNYDLERLVSIEFFNFKISDQHRRDLNLNKIIGI